MSRKPTKTPCSLAEMAVSTTDLAALLGLSPRRIRQLETEGHLKSSGRNLWALGEAVQAYLAFKDSVAEKRSSEAVNDRLREARTEAVELENLRKSGGLIQHARQDALAIIDTVIGGLRAGLYAMPARITADLGIRLRIENALNDVLADAAKRAGELAEGTDHDGE